MDEREFVAAAEAELRRIDDALTELERDDFDWQLAEGVLTAEFDDRSKLIVSVNRPAREIWVATRSQGLHFGWDAQASTWRTAKGQELWATLSGFLTEELEEEIHL